MVTLFIILILFIGAYAGYKKGIVLQLIQTIGYAIVFIFAMESYRALSERLYLLVPYPTPFAPESNPYRFYHESLMFSLDQSYYDILSFITIILVGWLIVRFVTKLISYTLEKFRAPEPVNGVGGAVLGFSINYLGIFLVLFFLSTIPYNVIQNRLADSFLAESFLTSTPTVSEGAYQTFIIDVNEEAKQNNPTMDIQPETEEENQE